MVYAIVGVLVLLADQLLKYYTVTHVALNVGIQSIVPGVFHLTNIKNFGALFGVLQNAAWLRWVLLVLLLAFTAAMVFAFFRGFLRTGFSRWTGALLLAGLLGNGIDRAIYGYVVDMIELDFMDFAIFNLADMLVIVCGILFCISLLLGGLRLAGDDEDYEDEVKAPAARRAVKEPIPTPNAERPTVRAASAPVRRPVPRSFEDETPVRPRRTEQAPARAIHSRAAVEDAEDAVRTVRRPAPRTAETPAASVRPAAPTARPAAPTAHPAAPTARPAAPAARPAAPTARPAAPTARPAAPTARPATPTRPAAPTARPAAPAVKPATKAAEPSADEFDLDSILAEFK